MPQYRYRALAQGGEIVVGEVEAPSDDEVLRRIEYLGHLPIDTEVVKPSVLGRSSGIGRRLPKSRDVTIFLRQLALLIGAGLPLEAALQTLGADTSKALSAFAGAIRAAISAGDSFAEALERQSAVIEPIYVAMVRAGEASGRLEPVLGAIVEDRTRRELLDGEGSLVIRHVDVLNARQLNALTSAIQEARAASRQHDLWVAVTLDRRQAHGDLTKLLRFFPSTVELPPLRHHIEDLHVLVPFFVAKLGQHGRLTCSPEAMQLLLRSKWPGNTEQLWQVLKRVMQKRRTGSIQPADLPPECWTVSRRLLSPLESMERDAIVQGLLDYQGNKVKAAKSLGMSRATIYRKIHEYGIVTPAS